MSYQAFIDLRVVCNYGDSRTCGMDGN